MIKRFEGISLAGILKEKNVVVVDANSFDDVVPEDIFKQILNILK